MYLPATCESQLKRSPSETLTLSLIISTENEWMYNQTHTKIIFDTTTKCFYYRLFVLGSVSVKIVRRKPIEFHMNKIEKVIHFVKQRYLYYQNWRLAGQL